MNRPFAFSENDEISEINVTPFVDVLLVLLVIFMVTVPLVTKTISVALPEESLKAPVEQSKKRYTLSINAKGQYFYEGKQMKPKELDQLIQSWESDSENITVFVRGDKNVRYRFVTNLIAKLKNKGIRGIGLSVKEKNR